MKLRHAAALSLVVWYLMAPPPTRLAAGRDAQNTAPLKLWSTQGTFDSKPDCEKALAEYASDPKKNPLYMPGEDAEVQKYLAQHKNPAQCVSSDDPRLKSN
ncbi:MAG: hypothetical protein ACREQR_18395 [Candidatus Binataceae bacterium]